MPHPAATFVASTLQASLLVFVNNPLNPGGSFFTGRYVYRRAVCAPDMLLALCHHISTHDLAVSAVRELLARPNEDGFPCLDVVKTTMS